MLNNYYYYATIGYNKLKERTRKGIPEGMRGVAWIKIAGVRELKYGREYLYKSLLSKINNPNFIEQKEEDVIIRDLHRTFPKNMIFNDKLGEEIYSWIDKFKSDNIDDKFYYYYDDATYLVTISYLYDGKKRRGYQLLLTDDTNNQEYIKLLDNYNNELIIEVKEKTQYLEELHDKLILGIAQLVDSRDNSTGGHIKRTSYIMRIFVTEVRKYNKYNLDDEFYDDIIKAAPMHDLGKIAVDDVILRKPGKYTKEEFEIMKHHASYGAEILDKILEGTDEKFKTIACNVAHFHHERVDGSGYPNGLTKDQIPIEARMMAICDVYDALVSKRVYKERMSFEEAKKIILEGMGSQFDNELRIYFLNSVDKFEEYYSSLEDF